MHILVVTAHPQPTSLTQSVAHAMAEELQSAGHEIERADLAAENFNPVFSGADHAAFARGAAVPRDVLAEQARLDRADALVIVYPIYWWSMPAILKGWIDRVFIAGWAFDEGEDGRIDKKLQRLKTHLIAIGGADQRTYARRGYFGAMRLQIDQGIFDFCGAPVLTSELLVADGVIDASGFAAKAGTIAKRISGTD